MSVEAGSEVLGLEGVLSREPSSATRRSRGTGGTGARSCVRGLWRLRAVRRGCARLRKHRLGKIVGRYPSVRQLGADAPLDGGPAPPLQPSEAGDSPAEKVGCYVPLKNCDRWKLIMRK